MASEIANGEKDRFVLLARFFEGLLAPRIPVNGIVGVQEQIGTFRVNEPVGVTVLSCLVSWLGGWNLLGLRGSVGAGRGLRGSVHRGRKDKEQYAGAKQLELFISSAQFHGSDQRSLPNPIVKACCLRDCLEKFVPTHFNWACLPKDATLAFHSSSQQGRVVNEFLRGMPFEDTRKPAKS